MTTERIDVLAAMDTAEEALNGFHEAKWGCPSPSARKLHEARAAVAELIEAAKNAKTFYWQVAQSDGLTTQQHYMSVQLAVALARVGAP